MELPGQFDCSIFGHFLGFFSLAGEASLVSISGAVLILRKLQVAFLFAVLLFMGTISKSLACLVTIGVRISGKKWLWKES